ncbi:cation-translocating P-type ATPase [Halalkalicoccus tibetensis]|uniref:Cation-translocating P-type ATPase n=1 Tax=Halalkalicoccus tibetensis TaxID=175632 RepID=A0ABD5V6Y9_9EURY
MNVNETTPERGEEGPRTVRLSVPEMDCPSCAGKVENALARTEGVVDADLSPTTGTAAVSYDPDRATRADVVAAVERAGYEVADGGEEDDGGMAPPSAVWSSPRAIKTWIGAAFLVAGLAVEFVLTGWNAPLFTVGWLELDVAGALLAAAVLASGLPVVRDGYYSALNRSLDIDLLMATAIVAASAIGYFVEAATLAVLFSIAELLEEYAMDRTRDSLRELLELAPEEATVLQDGTERTVPVEAVDIGDLVAVRPGERIPVDGVVREGESAVDQSPITGESVPADKAPGDEVYAGTIAEAGYLEIETTAESDGTTLSRIITLVQEAQSKRTESERFVDRFAGYYTPVIVALAVLTALVPPLVAGAAWGTWFVRGLTLLVIACPCAFVISTPVSVASGVTAAARNGVLIKGGNHLESMGAVDAVAFDKTGTLTTGDLAVTDVVPFGGSERELLGHAAALESRSEHPIAGAILDRADDEGISPPAVSGFESLTGKGVRGEVDGAEHYAGKPALFEELGFDLSGRATETDGGTSARPMADPGRAVETVATLERDGKTVVLVGTDERLLGAIGVADEVRPGAKRAIEALHELGIAPLVMLTGDNEGTARAVARELGVDEYRADLLPDEKVEAVEDLEAEHGSVAMVGDGINDAPALATATVSVAMGAAGTDTAIETADIALMGDDVSRLPYLYALSNEANDVIRQNIWSSLGVKLLLAVGVPLGYVSVALAVVVGDMGMSLAVTGNAMRLSRVSPERYLER